MYKIKCLYREFTSFEGSLFKYSLSFSLLLALAPSLLIFALMFKFAYLDDTIILNFIMNFIPDGNLETINQLFQFFTSKDYLILYRYDVCFLLSGKSQYFFFSFD